MSIFSLERKEGETFEDYKRRRNALKIKERLESKPKMVWPASKGTYVKPEPEGEKECEK